MGVRARGVPASAGARGSVADRIGGGRRGHRRGGERVGPAPHPRRGLGGAGRPPAPAGPRPPAHPKGRPPPPAPPRPRPAYPPRGGRHRRPLRGRRGTRAPGRRGDRRRRHRRGGRGRTLPGTRAARRRAPRGSGRAARRRRPRGEAKTALRGSAGADRRLRHPLEDADAMTALLLAALTIASDPPRVQLGETAKARLRIEASSEPRLSASAGRIENLRADGNGRWSADYLPPDDSVPQLAVISASAGSEAVFFALPLWGQGDAVVKTRPRARIEVRIGDERYPAVADRKGIAVVPVNVPPGVTAARHGAQSIDLHVPPLRLLHLALDREKVRADREEKVHVLLFAVAPGGVPRADARLAVRVTRGEISPPRPRAAGVYEASWTLPPGPAGAAWLSAELAEAPDQPSEATIALQPGPAASLRLQADRKRIVAGEEDLTARAVALDAAGNPSGEPLQFETTLGEVRGEGPEVRVHVPGSFGGQSELRLL